MENYKFTITNYILITQLLITIINSLQLQIHYWGLGIKTFVYCDDTQATHTPEV